MQCCCQAVQDDQQLLAQVQQEPAWQVTDSICTLPAWLMQHVPQLALHVSA